MESVVGLATSVVDGALSVAKSAAAKEVALHLGVEGDLEVIKDEFELMQTYLVATDEERSKDPVARVWARQVRDVAYDVEDHVQDFSIHLGGSSRWLFSPSKILNRRRIATEMKKLRARVDNASKRRTLYFPTQASLTPAESGLITRAPGPDGSAPSNLEAQTAALEKARHVEELKRSSGVRLGKLLARRDDSLMVVSMCTTATTTTLIGEAYDELAAATGQFRCRAWVTVLNPFDLTKFFRSIVRQFHANDVGQDVQEGTIETMGFQQLIESMAQKLETKRYLLVIDEISTREEWDSIKMYLPPGAMNGSRIIITSRRADVAKYCAGGHISSSFSLVDDSVILPAFCNMDPMADEPAEASFGASNLENIASTSEIEEHIETNSTAIVIAERIRDQISTAMARVEACGLVGREKEMEWLINKIMDTGFENDNFALSICGMRGIGKTALVKSFYHRLDVTNYFTHRAWITVSDSLSKDELIQNVIQHFKSTSTLLQDKSMELVEFYEMNKGNHCFRCLVVVDGLSNKTEWEAVNSSLFLEDYKAVLRIVVTTTELQVANYCSKNGDLIYNLSRLHEDDASKLFRLTVFGRDENLDLGHDMNEQANQILDKCGGIPFAIIHVGRHLASAPRTAIEWQKCNEHLNLDELDGNPDLAPMRTTLESCYNSLPYHFKYCFLYLSIFQDDYNIMRRRLVKRWIAEGYVRGIRGSEAEEVGERIFNEFLSMTIIQPTKYSAFTSGRVTSCSVHPLMLEVSMSKAMEEKLVQILDNQNNAMPFKDTIRHLVVRRSWRRDQDEYKRINLSHVRSLTVFGEWRSFFLSRNMRMLRVLDLEGVEGLTGHELKHIGKFLHLKYLGLRSTRIEHLPSSIGKLQCLETLDIRYTNVRTLPSTIAGLTRLRVLRAGLFSAFSDRKVDKKNDPWGLDLAKEIGALRTLHTLGTISIRSPPVIEELKNLTQLQRLSVTGITYESVNSLFTNLLHLSSLTSLALHSDHLDSELWSWGFHLLGRLQVLKISGLFLDPYCLKDLKNLRKLYLHNIRDMFCKSDEQQTPDITYVLAELPNLTNLLLLADSTKEPSLVFTDSGFRVLELLELSNLADIEFLLFLQGAVPKLKTLQIGSCDKLKILSFDPGAAPNLETLQINGCDNLTQSGLSGVFELQHLNLTSRASLMSRFSGFCG